MKKAFIILYAAAAAVLLCGCRDEFYSGHRDMEHLRPVQTIGLDAEGEALTLSVSSGIGPDGAPPLVMKATAAGIESAAARLQDWSPEDELFYAHVRYILLGESMAAADSVTGLETVLDWVERSPAMRMDTPLILVGGSAADAVIGALGGDTDVTERLASLERYLNAQGRSIPTLRQTASSLLERGCALCLSVGLFPDEGINYTETENAIAVVPTGLALLRSEAPASVEWLTQNESMGVSLLSGSVAGSHVPVGSGTLELIRGHAEASGLWTPDGAPMGLYIRCELSAGVLERCPDDTDELLAEALEDAAAAWLLDAVSLSQSLSCDFLRLEDAALKSAPDRRAAALQWAESFSTLPVAVSVQAEIGRSYDLAG